MTEPYDRLNELSYRLGNLGIRTQARDESRYAHPDIILSERQWRVLLDDLDAKGFAVIEKETTNTR